MATRIQGEVDGIDPHCLTLHEMFRVIGDQLTIKDVQMLKYLYGGIMSDDMWHKIDSGFSFLLALEKMKRVDETNFKHLLHLLRIISRHDLSRCVTLRKRQTVERDPVDEYLESTARFTTKRRRGKATYSIISDPNPSSASPPTPSTSSPTPSTSTAGLASSPCAPCANPPPSPSAPSNPTPSTSRTEAASSAQGSGPTPSPLQDIADPPAPPVRPRRRRRVKGRRRKGRRKQNERQEAEEQLGASLGEGGTATSGEAIRKKITCDIRLRVRAEYVQHFSALEGNVFSNKAELVERQFEKFSQANTILKSRDLGSIICDIKFSELTYLDAFWRDYINGSLLEALKGVFITESLKQAVGHEAIKLLVNVDEDDYEAGRLKLLENLKD